MAFIGYDLRIVYPKGYIPPELKTQWDYYYTDMKFVQDDALERIEEIFNSRGFWPRPCGAQTPLEIAASYSSNKVLKFLLGRLPRCSCCLFSAIESLNVDGVEIILTKGVTLKACHDWERASFLAAVNEPRPWSPHLEDIPEWSQMSKRLQITHLLTLHGAK
jgi:hypothetical protein